jgi:hypothetical protein
VFAPFLVFFYTLLGKGLIFDGWPGWFYVFQRTYAEVLLSLRRIEQKLSRERGRGVRSRLQGAGSREQGARSRGQGVASGGRAGSAEEGPRGAERRVGEGKSV